MRIEDFGPGHGVPQGQILRHEVDVEQATAHILEIPDALGAVVLGDPVTHVGDIPYQRRSLSPAAERRAMICCRRSVNVAGPWMTRARVSARCSQVQADCA